MTEEKRYLPLFDENGDWALARPDLYVLVRMGANDDQDEESVRFIYQCIAEISDNTKSGLLEPEVALEEKFIRRHLTERGYAAKVLMELRRLSSSGVEPTLGKAVKIVARSLYEEKNSRAESSIMDQVKKAFSVNKWRNTCHLELAFRLFVPENGSFEADPEAFDAFLAIAKDLEMSMDAVCKQGHLEWNPWRVPEQITPAFAGEITGLCAEERALISAA